MHDFATIEIQEIKQTKQTVNDDLGFPLFRLFFFSSQQNGGTLQKCDDCVDDKYTAFSTQYSFCIIFPIKHLVIMQGVSTLWCRATVLIGCLWLKCFSTLLTLTFCLLCLQRLRKGLDKQFCSMEKEDLKVLNKGEEEEMVTLLFFSFYISADVGILAFRLIRPHHVFFIHPLGAAGLLSMSLAAGPGGPWGAVYRGLPPPAALLDARVVRQIHLHPYHSPWCWSGVAALHSR